MADEIPVPEVDVVAAANECQRFLDRRKFDLVDYSFINIECYPPPTDSTTPELNKFAKLWEAVFDHADKVTIGNNGEGFPHELVKTFDVKTKEIEATVNSNQEYWDELRGIIMPLYAKSGYFEDWKKRWTKIELFYDPIGMDVTTTEMFTNKKSGERIRGELTRATNLPPGFVIRVH